MTDKPERTLPTDVDDKRRSLALSYQRPLLRYFTRRGLPLDLAEDCVQDVFLRLAKSDVSAVPNAEAYLFAMAHSVLIDRTRRAKVRKSAMHVPMDIDFDGEEPSPSRVLEGREKLQRVAAALRQLTPKTREVFLLNRLDGLTYTQLAARYGVGVSAIEKHMTKALAHLRSQVRDD